MPYNILDMRSVTNWRQFKLSLKPPTELTEIDFFLHNNTLLYVQIDWPQIIRLTK